MPFPLVVYTRVFYFYYEMYMWKATSLVLQRTKEIDLKINLKNTYSKIKKSGG